MNRIIILLDKSISRIENNILEKYKEGTPKISLVLFDKKIYNQTYNNIEDINIKEIDILNNLLDKLRG